VPTDPPRDVTTGELWRSLERVTATLETLTRTVAGMPAQIIADLDGRTLERIAALSSATQAQHEAHDGRLVDLDTRLVALEAWRADQGAAQAVQRADVRLLRGIVLGACGFILTAVLAAIVALVVTHT
jgi:hypothetical protein